MAQLLNHEVKLYKVFFCEYIYSHKPADLNQRYLKVMENIEMLEKKLRCWKKGKK